MTETGVQSVAAQVDEWLRGFEDGAGSRRQRRGLRDVRRRGFWRDLVAFTWNIKTVEGPAGVKDMLDHTLAHTKPRGWHTVEPPTEADGIADAWIEFETEVGPRPRPPAAARTARRGRCSRRSYELKGHEEPAGASRPQGAEHGADPRPPDVAREARGRGRAARLRDAAGRRDHRRRPGRHRARRAPAPARRADDHRRAQRAARRLVAQALQVALPARPGLVRPPAVHQVPGQLAGVLAEGQDRRLAGDVHAGDGAQLLELHDGEERAATTPTPASGRSSSSATAAEITLRPKQLVLATGMSGQGRTCPRSPGMDVFKGDQHHSSEHPGPDAYKGKRAVVIGSNNSAHDICAALWEAGADVTMVQRSSTHVARSDSLMDIALGALYSEEAVGERRHDREGGHDLRVAAVPDPARAPDPGLRADPRAGRRLLRAARGRPGSSSTGATTTRGCS